LRVINDRGAYGRRLTVYI